MWHILVTTRSGATYLFRLHGERTYVTSHGSSSGWNLTNQLVEPASAVPHHGERMDLRDTDGSFLVLTSLVQSVRVIDRYTPWAV